MAQPKRFIKIYSQGKMQGFEVWADHDTGVQYLFGFSGYAAGITPLLNADGKPVVTPKEELERLQEE